MKEYYSFAFAVFFLLNVANIQATSIKREIASKEAFCACMGTYVRLSFEVKNKSITNIKVVKSSSSNRCDELHIKSLSLAGTGGHPDGVTAIAVTGYAPKNKTIKYEQCLIEDQIELDNYWFVEDVSINLDKVNARKD